eukprot:52418-Pleurochrysis_carterae.AAC.1
MRSARCEPMRTCTVQGELELKPRAFSVDVAFFPLLGTCTRGRGGAHEADLRRLRESDDSSLHSPGWHALLVDGRAVCRRAVLTLPALVPCPIPPQANHPLSPGWIERANHNGLEMQHSD